jgi:hypothetical protein
VVRRYSRAFDSNQRESRGDVSDAAPGRIVSFPCAVALEYFRRLAEQRGNASEAHVKWSELQQEAAHGHERPAINFLPAHHTDKKQSEPRFQVIHLSSLLEHPQLLGPNSPLSGRDTPRIVLIGGTYQAGRDQCLTPVGLVPGVELMAEIIDAECAGRFIGESSHYAALAIDVLGGLLLVCFTWYFRAPWASLATLAFIPVASVIGSLCAFHVAAHWFNFVPVLLGVWIHLEWDRAREAHHMRKELERYREKFGALT